MPPALQQALLERIPQLEAEDGLRELTVSAYPHLKRSAQRGIVRDWQQLARSKPSASRADGNGHQAEAIPHLRNADEINRWLARQGVR